MNNRQMSATAFDRAQRVLPGGVNSPVRAFKGVGGTPVFISKGSGAWISDIDGNRYIDFVGSWGPLILGHAYPSVVEEILNTAKTGTSFGAPTEIETELAELIISFVPSIQMIRFVNSGTEATMSAVRLARGFTGREMIVKFEGCYHGHGDSFLIAAGSGATTCGVPDSPGITEAVAGNTLIAQYNDIESVSKIFEQHRHKIAAIIVEPVAGNMGVVLPESGFLQSLREITAKNGSLLIFDEVMTGFRLARGGAQEIFGVKPDITTLGKIVGGGLPIAAYGASREIMSHVAPLGPVYQAGTLSGNPLAVAAGLATLRAIKNDQYFYKNLAKNTDRLRQSILSDCRNLGIKCVCNQIGSMLTLFFTELKSVKNYSDAKKSDIKVYSRYFHEMLNAGIYLPPSQFESWFVSAAHSDVELDMAIKKSRIALELLKEQR